MKGHTKFRLGRSTLQLISVSGPGTYVTQFAWKYLRRYCIRPVFRVIVCCDLDV